MSPQHENSPMFLYACGTEACTRHETETQQWIQKCGSEAGHHSAGEDFGSHSRVERRQLGKKAESG